MTRADHLSDDVLSLLVDERLPPAEVPAAQAHLATCAECGQRLDELRAVTRLLRRLPAVEPPRDFSIGPRAVPEPARVVRLRRWYAWTRTSAASLAAAFAVLLVASAFLDAGAP
ncbi:MAG: hypothetical protein M3336_00395, partial [Chloroflexota bacterium]|nr:hypothetical protein [Chloroflexota bacterium]